jgi:hypothetical protein
MEITSQVLNAYKELSNSLGKATLNSLYPNEFEFYMCAFELVDYRDKTVDYLIFPVNPNNLKETDQNIETIERSAGGIVTLSSSLYQPVNISLSGDFGRRFKFLIGRDNIEAVAVSFNGEKKKEFSKQIKTGYGVMKVLENIIKVSKTLDSFGNPYKLYFYNTIMGNSYIVKQVILNKEQTFPTSNMVPNYSIQMVGVAPLNTANKKGKGKNLSEMTTSASLMNTVNKLQRVVNQDINSALRSKSLN